MTTMSTARDEQQQHPLLLSPASSKAHLEFEAEEQHQRLKKERKALSRAFQLERDSIRGLGSGSETSSIKSRCSLDERAFQDDSIRRVEHTVQPGDTLEGICVMYNVKSADVKRLNRLWTNDSIHLRKTLEIPLTVQEFKSRSVERPKKKTSNRAFESHRYSDPTAGVNLSLPVRPPDAFTSARASSTAASPLIGSKKTDKSPESPKYPPSYYRSDPNPRSTSMNSSPFLLPPPSVSTIPISSIPSMPSPRSPISTQELLDRIDSDVSSILSALKTVDPLPALPRARPKRRIADLRSKTTRVTIAPIEPSAASAFVSSPVPLRVVFTLTPLLGLLPLEVQTTVKENVAGRLQKSLSTSFFQKLNIQREEWMDMVHISAGKSSEDDGWSEGTISP